MAKQDKTPKAENTDLMSLAIEKKPSIVSDIDKLHADSLKRFSTRDVQKKRSSENHLQREYDIDVKKTFDTSLKNCLDYDGEIDDLKFKHLQSVLSAGSCKFDR